MVKLTPWYRPSLKLMKAGKKTASQRPEADGPSFEQAIQRLEKIVADILIDMEMRDRLKSGRGNALLISGSIYSACRFLEL